MRAIVLALLLSACSSNIPDEILVKIHEHRVAYCAKTADSAVKKAAIAAIRMQIPAYPSEGICTGLVTC